MVKRIKQFLTLAVAVALIFAYLVIRGYIVFDHSGVRRGEGVYWNDVLYIPSSGEYTEGKTLAKTTDGWQINEVEEDPSHTFIVLRSFLDNYLLVREDYEIPASGDISLAWWNGKIINDDEFLDAITNILANAEATFTHETDGIFQLTDRQHMRLLRVGYADCPIATEHGGYLGTIDGTWYLSLEQTADDTGAVCCYEIPQEYIPVLSKYSS